MSSRFLATLFMLLALKLALSARNAQAAAAVSCGAGNAKHEIVELALGKIFHDTFEATGYKPEDCDRNIQSFARRAMEKGIDLSDSKVLYLMRRNREGGTLLNGLLPRNPRSPNIAWNYHVVLEHGGKIYDFDYGKNPEPVEKSKYMELMFGPPEKMPIVREMLVKSIPAEEYVSLRDDPGFQNIGFGGAKNDPVFPAQNALEYFARERHDSGVADTIPAPPPSSERMPGSLPGRAKPHELAAKLGFHTYADSAEVFDRELRKYIGEATPEELGGSHELTEHRKTQSDVNEFAERGGQLPALLSLHVVTPVTMPGQAGEKGYLVRIRNDGSGRVKPTDYILFENKFDAMVFLDLRSRLQKEFEKRLFEARDPSSWNSTLVRLKQRMRLGANAQTKHGDWIRSFAAWSTEMTGDPRHVYGSILEGPVYLRAEEPGTLWVVGKSILKGDPSKIVRMQSQNPDLVVEKVIIDDKELSSSAGPRYRALVREVPDTEIVSYVQRLFDQVLEPSDRLKKIRANLTPKQARAIQLAHEIGMGQNGEYSRGQIGLKSRELEAEFQDRDDRGAILKERVAGEEKSKLSSALDAMKGFIWGEPKEATDVLPEMKVGSPYRGGPTAHDFAAHDRENEPTPFLKTSFELLSADLAKASKSEESPSLVQKLARFRKAAEKTGHPADLKLAGDLEQRAPKSVQARIWEANNLVNRISQGNVAVKVSNYVGQNRGLISLRAQTFNAEKNQPIVLHTLILENAPEELHERLLSLSIGAGKFSDFRFRKDSSSFQVFFNNSQQVAEAALVVHEYMTEFSASGNGRNYKVHQWGSGDIANVGKIGDHIQLHEGHTPISGRIVGIFRSPKSTEVSIQDGAGHLHRVESSSPKLSADYRIAASEEKWAILASDREEGFKAAIRARKNPFVRMRFSWGEAGSFEIAGRVLRRSSKESSNGGGEIYVIESADGSRSFLDVSLFGQDRRGLQSFMVTESNGSVEHEMALSGPDRTDFTSIVESRFEEALPKTPDPEKSSQPIPWPKPRR